MKAGSDSTRDGRRWAVRVTLVIDGSSRSVEVDRDAGTVTVEGQVHPFRLVTDGDERTELEIGGERLLVRGWPVGRDRPLAELSVNGERVAWTEHTISASATSRGAAPPAPPPARPAPAGASAAPRSASVPGAIVPPMPGKIVELRVRDGELVAVGQVLLVLEAMKMRNEILAPHAGTVADLAVRVGDNVRGGEPMLRVRAL